MDNELKPCPFCGGEAEHEIFDDGFFVYCRVMCKPCGVMMTKAYLRYSTGNEGIVAWNRRVANGT